MVKIPHVKEASLLLLENKEGKYLIQNRKSISKAGEQWGFFGGGCEQGETPEQGLEREIQEELGFHIQDYVYIGFVLAYAPVMENHVKRNFFLAKTDKSIEEFEILEGDYGVFKSFDEIKKLDYFMWENDAFDLIEKMLGAYYGK